MQWVLFAIVAACAVAAAVGLVVRPNPLHGALFLVGNLFCVAVLYLMLGAEFLALAQVIADGTYEEIYYACRKPNGTPCFSPGSLPAEFAPTA